VKGVFTEPQAVIWSLAYFLDSRDCQSLHCTSFDKCGPVILRPRVATIIESYDLGGLASVDVKSMRSLGSSDQHGQRAGFECDENTPWDLLVRRLGSCGCTGYLISTIRSPVVKVEFGGGVAVDRTYGSRCYVLHGLQLLSASRRSSRVSGTLRPMQGAVTLFRFQPFARSLGRTGKGARRIWAGYPVQRS